MLQRILTCGILWLRHNLKVSLHSKQPHHECDSLSRDIMSHSQDGFPSLRFVRLISYNHSQRRKACLPN